MDASWKGRERLAVGREQCRMKLFIWRSDKEEENPLRGRERPAKGILGKLLRTMFSGTGRSVAPELPVGKLGKLGDGIHGEAWQLSRFRARREVGRGALTSPSMRLLSPTTSREEEACISRWRDESLLRNTKKSGEIGLPFS